MAKRVYYIPVNMKQETAKKSDFFLQLEKEFKQSFPDGNGFVKLVDFLASQECREKNVYYYGAALGGIVGDLERIGCGYYKIKCESSYNSWKNTLLDIEEHQRKRMGRLFGGVLRRKELERFKQDWLTRFGEQRLKDLQESHIVVIEGNNVNMAPNWRGDYPVYYIPVYRCKHQYDEEWGSRLAELLRLGFLPEVDSEGYRNLTSKAEFWKWLKGFCNMSEEAERIEPDEDTIRKALFEIRQRDYKRALIPKYTEEIFQVDKGCWDLWPYVEYGPGKQSSVPGDLLDVSGWEKELYARNPQDDIAGNGEWAAIDFGTWNTMVAVWQENGIHMRRIGMQDRPNGEDEQYENATVLYFINVDAFLEAYNTPDKLGRPDTEFDQIKVAFAAKKDFEERIHLNREAEEIMQFQEQLKQWTNDPGRIIYVKYQGQWQELKYASLDNEAPDPVEIYAYYIGLYLNNMHQQKIYLKYLLSYSSTYCSGNLDMLRESFERGLRKSLPAEIAGDEELMKEFDVRLYMDEATAYAATALLHYRMQAVAVQKGDFSLGDNNKLPKLEQYTEAMNEGGLFYGVYDFGGGTLDFSFGMMERRNGKDVIMPWERGGASDSGCENLLEELAYRIFSGNRDKLVRKNILCFAPPGLTNLADNPLVGHSAAARINTIRLIEALRKNWIDNTLDDEILIRLRSENEEYYDVVLPKNSDKGKDNNSDVTKDKFIILDSGLDIKKFFEEKIRRGVRLFLWQFQYTAAGKGIDKNRPRFIFLGGSASKSEMVRKIFCEEIEKDGVEHQYYLHQPLATEYDKARKKENPDISIPNAKSGVVYGLLTARPDSPGVRVESHEMSLRYFQYHLGRRVPDEIYYDPSGLFELLVSANDLSPDVFCHLGEVPLTGDSMEILYTRKPEYAFYRKEKELLPAALVSVTTIPVSDYCGKEYHLYCRPAMYTDRLGNSKYSDIVLELWISRQGEEKIGDIKSMEKLIGWFEFLPSPCFRKASP